MDVCGATVEIDRSGGQGHCWQIADELPDQIILEIEGEIIDGRMAVCDDIVLSNGQHYRWA